MPQVQIQWKETGKINPHTIWWFVMAMASGIVHGIEPGLSIRSGSSAGPFTEWGFSKSKYYALINYQIFQRSYCLSFIIGVVIQYSLPPDTQTLSLSLLSCLCSCQSFCRRMMAAVNSFTPSSSLTHCHGDNMAAICALTLGFPLRHTRRWSFVSVALAPLIVVLVPLLHTLFSLSGRQQSVWCSILN